MNMKVEGFLQTIVPLHSKARGMYVDRGVTMYTDKISDAMVLFLAAQFEMYEKQGKACLKGDIASLYARKAEISERRLYDNMTYRDYLRLMYGDHHNKSN